MTARTGGGVDDDPIERTVGEIGQQRLHPLGRQELGRIGRRASGGDREQVRIDRPLNHVAHAGVADQDLRQAALVRETQRAVQAGPAHVGVDDQDARPAVGQRHRDVHRRRRLAFERLRRW